MASSSQMRRTCWLWLIVMTLLVVALVEGSIFDDEDEDVGPHGRRYARDRGKRAAHAREREQRRSLADEEPRAPLTIKKFDDHKGWVDPSDPEEEDEIFERNYLQVAYQRGTMENDDLNSPHMKVKSLRAYFMHIMDIDSRGLEVDEIRYIEQKVKEFKQQEGLFDEEQELPHGYLSRGKPVAFIKGVHSSLAQRRRLQQAMERTPGMGGSLGGGMGRADRGPSGNEGRPGVFYPTEDSALELEARREMRRRLIFSDQDF